MNNPDGQPPPAPEFSHPEVPGWSVPPLLPHYVSYSPPPDEIGSVTKSPPPDALPELPPASYGWFGESDELF